MRFAICAGNTVVIRWQVDGQVDGSFGGRISGTFSGNSVAESVSSHWESLEITGALLAESLEKSCDKHYFPAFFIAEAFADRKKGERERGEG
jgi:hypothetical protein